MEEALAQARDQALESSRLKSEFLARASHEIRTPMNSIIGLNELLLETPLSDGQREYVETMQHSADGLLEIIDDILDFTRAEAGKMRYIAVDFAPALVVHDAIALFARKAQAKNLTLNAEVEPEATVRLRGDPGRLRQVLINLIGNAVKFTERGYIHVKAGVVERTPESVLLRFEVRDTGIGVPSVARHRLFQPFTQVDGSTERPEGGMGLGLAICKQLVELMGGEIGMESEEEVGSTFWFTTRFAHAATVGEQETDEDRRSAAAADVLQPSAAERPLILLVEDNPANRRLAVLQLERLGYAVNAVSDGYQALDALAREGRDLCPHLDGLPDAGVGRA